MPTAVNAPHSRRFGVEIECGIPLKGNQTYIDRTAGAILKKAGFEVGYYSDGKWEIGEDGSGVEIKTPILQGAVGFAALHKAYKTLIENGAYVTEADGMHVHIDAPEFIHDHDLAGRLLDSWTPNRDLIHLMVSKRRRKSNMCPKFNATTIAEVKQGRRWLGGYRDLNLTSLGNHGSIEVRLHEGILNYQWARAWIRFLQKFIHHVVHTGEVLPQFKTLDELLQDIRIHPGTQGILRRKAEWYDQNEPDNIRQDNGYRADES